MVHKVTGGITQFGFDPPLPLSFHLSLPPRSAQKYYPRINMNRCSGCGKEYWPRQAWIHLKCAVVNDQHEVNDDLLAEVPAVNTRKEIRQVRWQRENRERYNRKLRDYMRKKRAG